MYGLKPVPFTLEAVSFQNNGDKDAAAKLWVASLICRLPESGMNAGSWAGEGGAFSLERREAEESLAAKRPEQVRIRL